MTAHLVLKVTEGDVIDVDIPLKPRSTDQKGGNGTVLRRGRVVIKEISGTQTKKGRYHMTLIRYKHYALFTRNLFTSATISYNILTCRK